MASNESETTENQRAGIVFAIAILTILVLTNVGVSMKLDPIYYLIGPYIDGAEVRRFINILRNMAFGELLSSWLIARAAVSRSFRLLT